MPIHFKEIEYGFEYGALTVERTCSDKSGWIVITVRGKNEVIEILSTPKGKLRVRMSQF